ncbi:hypothetical protein ACNUDN_06710 [Mycobacterium sp. smrl_JER01]|uniref:hypothetical protein n=1 Tax=Mycobacterium sp. smrl_JER01 TaxID=3402633 RepID=UPI003AC307C5
MQRRTVTLIAATILGATVGATLSAPPAAANPDWGLNGTYVATSNGEWARKNEIFFDQASIRSTWTITTDCSYPGECTGTVTSDWGWSAPIYQKSGVWYVKRALENWVPCPDGTAAPGLGIYRFRPTTPDGTATDPSSTTLVGEDQATGVSGACGINKSVFINMPFKLVKQS